MSTTVDLLKLRALGDTLYFFYTSILLLTGFVDAMDISDIMTKIIKEHTKKITCSAKIY